MIDRISGQGVVNLPADVVASEDEWDLQLDVLGPNAPIAELQAMLERAPNPQSANAQCLMGFLAHHAQQQIR